MPFFESVFNEFQQYTSVIVADDVGILILSPMPVADLERGVQPLAREVHPKNCVATPTTGHMNAFMTRV